MNFHWLAIAVFIVSLGACATPESAIGQTKLAEMKVAADQGDPKASLSLAIAISMRGKVAGTFAEALKHAQAAKRADISGAGILQARMLEANLRFDEAFAAYLSFAMQSNRPTKFRAQSLIRLRDIMDHVPVHSAEIKQLLNLSEAPGLLGELAALAAEKGAIRLRSDALLSKARRALGIVSKYQASGRLSSLAALSINPSMGNTYETEANPLFSESIASVDGILSLGEEGSGVYAVSIDLLEAKGAREVRIEQVEQLVVQLNNKEIGRINRLKEPGATIARIPLPSGAHGTLKLWIGSRAPDPRVRVSIRPRRRQSTEKLAVHKLENLADLDLALADNDVVRAIKAAHEMEALAPIASVSMARLHALDPGFSLRRKARGEAELLRAALQLAPDAREVQRALVLELFAAGEIEEAKAVSRHMQSAPLALQLVLAQETQDARKARTLSTKLIAHAPTSCNAHIAYMAAHEHRLRFDKSDWHLNVPFCSAVQLRAAEILKSSWRNNDAIALLKAHIARTSRGVERARSTLLLGRVYRALGRDNAAEKILRQALNERILVGEFLEELARLRTLAKDPTEAASLNARLVRQGGSDFDVARSRFDPSIDLGLPLRNGHALAQVAIEKRRKEILEGKPQPSIRILLKERHTRILNDGSMVHREHRIVELLDDGAVERFGEIPLPDDAQVLIARTYKPSSDGTLQPIEPEQISEKTSLSLPALVPGAIIEAAWLWHTSAADATKGHWVMRPFYFDDLDGPVEEAHFLLRTSEESKPQIQTYGRSPRREEVEPGLLRYSLSGVHRARDEKLNPRKDLHRNALFATSGTSLKQLQRLLLDRLSDQRRLLPSVRRWALEQVKGMKGSINRLQALYTRVIGHVLDSDLDVFNASVAHTIKNRAGNRSLLLQTACVAVGIHCDLVLLEPRYAEDPTGKELPYAGRFFYAVVRARLPTGEVWLDPNRTHAPFGYLVPLARGARGIVMEDIQPNFIRSPTTVKDDGKRHIDCEGTIVDTQILNMECREKLTGHEAIDRRAKLSSYGPTNQKRYVEVFAKRIFPSSRIHSIQITDLESSNRPLGLSWSADVKLVREDDHRFMMSVGLSPTFLTRTTVLIPSRQSPLFTLRQFDVVFNLTLKTEGLFRFSQKSQTSTVDHDMLQLERTIRVGKDQQRLTVRKQFHLDADRVLPQDYQRWVDTARRVDKLERLRITIER